MKYFYLLVLLTLSTQIWAQLPKTKFELSAGTETVSYQEGIDFLTNLAQKNASLSFKPLGNTDCGKPLHTLVFSADKDFDPQSIKQKGKTIILIINAIHPGEPDGIDATLMLFRDICEQNKLQNLLKNTVLVAIPFYNVDGVLNRSSFSRANQNGPKAYGFRGNSQNLDLNRDFIKLDSENAKTFTQIFQTWQPDILIDNHVSNGADYQYVFTCLVTQENKLGGVLGDFLRNQMLPDLQKSMEAKKIDMPPYVNVWEAVPDSGFVQFIESPRYSSGYAALFHTLAFVPETHMLKPYKQRVEATYQFMRTMLEYAAENGAKIQKMRAESVEKSLTQSSFPLHWQVNKQKFEWINFKGYEASFIKSKVTGLQRLFYDQKKPFQKKIKFFNQYEPQIIVQKPWAYIIPQAYQKVIERLKINRVAIKTITQKQDIATTAYYIQQYKTVQQPFEGHYLHYNTQISPQNQVYEAQEGDFLVILNQPANRYLMETLEPQAPDSFFNWNFFDAILQQKEGFSAYVFEEIAEKLLAQNPELQQQFTAKKQTDAQFAQSAEAQLNFIYKNSPYYEKTHQQYLIRRIEKEQPLPYK